MGTRGRRRWLKSISHFPPLLQQPHLKSNFISAFPSQGKESDCCKQRQHSLLLIPILPEVSEAVSESQQEKQAAVGTAGRKDMGIY